jgi:diguanylate cyclase (GGDEF)-like protein
MIFIASVEKTIYINKVGLEFFNCKDTSEFRGKYNNISNFFIEEDGCLNKYSSGKNWLEHIFNSKNRRGKVKLKTPVDDKMEYYFYIQLSRLKKDKYLLYFTDITRLERDKDLIRKLADYDALTNIYSRVKFNEMFPLYINRALSYNERFSIILFDIDHFKSINDTYGHNIGDRVLIELTSVVKSVIREKKMRKNTIFSRWGGEEFVVLVQFSDKKKVYQLSEILRKEIESYPFEVVKKVTCSFGVTQFKVDDTQVDIFHRVDNALYEAKDTGRNRVVMR